MTWENREVFFICRVFVHRDPDMLQHKGSTKQKLSILYGSASHPKPIVLSLWYDRYFIAWTTLNPKRPSAIGSRPNNAKATDTSFQSSFHFFIHEANVHGIVSTDEKKLFKRISKSLKNVESCNVCWPLLYGILAGYIKVSLYGW